MWNTKFIKSAVWPEDYPEPLYDEVAFMGRSNAGKSSLINSIAQSQVAKVSRKPGKTRLINFFEVNEKYQLVDLPGYGFAKVSLTERKKWEQMVKTYVSVRHSLVGFVLVMDIRRNWSDKEQQLVQWMEALHKKGLVVLSKADKLKSLQQMRSQQWIKKQVNWPIICCSSLKKIGVHEVGKQIQEWIKK